MKDITDYFSSPTKARKSAEVVETIKSSQDSSDQNVNSENKIKDNSDTSKVSKNEPKRIKKKKRRKPTDPEVRGVTELLSNNFSLTSPNTSDAKMTNSPSFKKSPKKGKRNSLEKCTHDLSQEKTYSNSKNKSDNISKSKSPQNFKEINPIDNDGFKPTTDDIVKINDDDESNSQTPNKISKVNAFQFMMNSRNNIIGQNSDGIVANEEDNNMSDTKSKLVTRRKLFQNWADQKGGLKRKREEIEKDKCIKYKMKKRIKRIKNLIEGKTEEKQGKKVKNSKSTAKSKKPKKILSSSDSESSTDATAKEHVLSNQILINLSRDIEENAQDIIISSPLPKKNKENGQNNLLNFFGVLTKEAKDERIEVFDDSSMEPSKNFIKIKMFTPESTKKRTSLFSLNRERTKSLTDESSQEIIKLKKHKKKNTAVKEKSLSETQLNDSLEDFHSPKQKQVKTGVKKSKKKKRDQLKKHDFSDDTDKQTELKIGTVSSEDLSNNLMAKDSKNNLCYPVVRKEDTTKDVKQPRNLKNGKSHEHSKNMDAFMVDESSEDSDVLQPKKKKISKLCIADDSEDSKSSGDQCLIAVGKPTKDLPIVKSKTRKKSKIRIIDDDSQGSKTDDVFNELIDITPRLKKENSLKSKGSKNVGTSVGTPKEEVQIKSGDPEIPGRVLRPKRNNINYTQLVKGYTEKISKINEEKSSSVKRNKKISNNDEFIEKVDVSSESDYEETPTRKPKVPAKVAPVFLKATPKPKLDPEVIEARKKFLLSGVPDSLKITVEKQRSIEEKEFDIFPTISHIQQKCHSIFWNLPRPNIKYIEESSLDTNEQSLNFHDLIVKKVPHKIIITSDSVKINHIKFLLDKIKAENPNYPVYKVFRHMYEKSGKNFLKEQPKARTPRRQSKKAIRKSSESVESPKLETVSKDWEMWSEKYKPRSSEEILGNHIGVGTLKNWLETWMNYSDEINSRGKRKRTNSNSETEFESTDCDSRDSTRLPGNTIILVGPCGCGKTSAVYAIANELGFNVLELNASSKRTGKRLLQELQEATQSHQMRKNENNAFTNYMSNDKIASKGLKSKKPELKNKKTDFDEKSDQKDKKKMCILLVEDIDLVFEQDEGFLASLSQLITTSKRPIILTTTDNSPAHVQRLSGQYESISFMPLSLQCLGVWLQILCLIEGLVIDKNVLGNLLEYNRGDIRKTLLEVQFWSQSGGQLEKSRVLPLKVQSSGSNLEATDEELKIDLSEDNLKENHFVHKNCIGSFEIFRDNHDYNVPLYLNLGLIWWNIPNILDIPSSTLERLNRQKGKRNINQEAINDDFGEKDKLKLNSILCLYDSLTLTDSLFSTVNFHKSNEPVVKNWLTDVKDSLELTERREDHGIYLDMVHEITHTLVNGYIENYRSIDEIKCNLNMALPDTRERRWRAKQHVCENFLKEPIALLNTLDRSSIALDYLPALRDIARYEEKRASSNTKRGNRFRHYLKNLNMDFKESTCKLACNVLSLPNDD